MRALLICIGLIFVSVYCGWTQPSSLSELNIFYVDNSRVVLEDGLTTGQKETLEKEMKEAFTRGEVVAFLSNGKQPVIATTKKESDAVIELLYRKNTERPNFNADKMALRNALYTRLKKLNGTLHIHYFLSDEAILDISRGNVTLTNFFPKELEAVSEKVTTLKVDINYGNRTGKVKKNKLEEALNFFNTENFSPVITYSIMNIQ